MSCLAMDGAWSQGTQEFVYIPTSDFLATQLTGMNCSIAAVFSMGTTGQNWSKSPIYNILYHILLYYMMHYICMNVHKIVLGMHDKQHDFEKC